MVYGLMCDSVVRFIRQTSSEGATRSLLEAGTKVKAKWADGKTYSAKVLGQHVSPSYVVCETD